MVLKESGHLRSNTPAKKNAAVTMYIADQYNGFQTALLLCYVLAGRAQDVGDILIVTMNAHEEQ